MNIYLGHASVIEVDEIILLVVVKDHIIPQVTRMGHNHSLLLKRELGIGWRQRIADFVGCLPGSTVHAPLPDSRGLGA